MFLPQTTKPLFETWVTCHPIYVYVVVPYSKMEWTSTSFHLMQQQSASFRPLQKLPPFWFMSTWRRIFKEFLRFETSLRLSLCFRNFATTCGGKGKLFFNMLMVNSLTALIWSLLACKSFSSRLWRFFSRRIDLKKSRFLAMRFIVSSSSWLSLLFYPRLFWHRTQLRWGLKIYRLIWGSEWQLPMVRDLLFVLFFFVFCVLDL